MGLTIKKQNKFSVILKENDTNSCTYQINRMLFDTLKKYLTPYRSYQPQAKKIKCIETGKIFESATEACKWIEYVRETDYCNKDLIKQCCRGKQKTSYGYHWEFAEI